MSLIETRPLAIYLQDHLAGATAGAELAHRARDSNEDEGDLGDFLKTLSRQIDEDRGVLIEMMDHLGIDRSRVSADCSRCAPRTQASGQSSERLGIRRASASSACPWPEYGFLSGFV